MHNMDTSYLTTQVTTIIGQLHGLFDDIGVETHERESREAEVRHASQKVLQHILTDDLTAFCSAVRNIKQPIKTCLSVRTTFSYINVYPDHRG